MRDVNNLNAKINQQNIDSIVYNNYGDKKIIKFLGVQPFFSDTFLGREVDLKAIHEILHESNNLLVLVNGEGGIGKTTLAAQYYLTYQDQYQHLGWIFAGKSLSDALLTLAIPLGINFTDTMPPEQRIVELLDQLRNLNKPSLLVIDNANDLKDLQNHYQALRRCANFHLLLTTRITEFEQVATFKIKPLEKETAFELFKKHYPKHQQIEDDLLGNILEAVGYNTLVIELLAKNLRNLNPIKINYSLTHLLGDLQDKGLLGLTQTKVISTTYHTTGIAIRKENPESIIEAMYELNNLSSKESVVLSIFAVLPAENILFDTLEKLITDDSNLEQTLTDLSQKGWLEYNEVSASFKVSPVIQEITKKKNNQLIKDCKGVFSILIEKLEYMPGTGHLFKITYEEAGLYVRYTESILNNFKIINEDIAILYDRVGNYYRVTGNLTKALSFFSNLNQLLEQLCKDYPHDVKFTDYLANSYYKLGETHFYFGELEQTLIFYSESNRIVKKLFEYNPTNDHLKNGFAVSNERLGDTHVSLGHYDKALVFYENFQRLENELYDANPQNVLIKNNLALSSYKLADTLIITSGNLANSLAFYEEFNLLEKELNVSFPENMEFKSNLAFSYLKLGELQSRMGNNENALKLYAECNRLMNEIYLTYPQNATFKHGLAVSFERLGSSAVALGDLDQALSNYEKYKLLDQELYESDPDNVLIKSNLAKSIIMIGSVYEKKQNMNLARNHYQIARGIIYELVEVSPDHIEFTKNLAWIEERLASVNLY
jgi:tetratricopeptide (TPR) repeat protein